MGDALALLQSIQIAINNYVFKGENVVVCKI